MRVCCLSLLTSSRACSFIIAVYTELKQPQCCSRITFIPKVLKVCEVD